MKTLVELSVSSLTIVAFLSAQPPITFLHVFHGDHSDHSENSLFSGAEDIEQTYIIVKRLGLGMGNGKWKGTPSPRQVKRQCKSLKTYNLCKLLSTAGLHQGHGLRGH